MNNTLNLSLIILFFALARGVQAAQAFEPVEIVLAGGIPLQVNGYSVPALADWNGDDLPTCSFFMPDPNQGEGSATTRR